MADDRRSIGVRVRPNSHDFIRHLRQQLATKKYTFTVDVAANTAQATKDVRTWANGALKKIHAVVPVSANMGKASADVADWRRRQSAFKTTIPINANLSAAQREVEAWRKIAGRDLVIDVKANVTGKGVENIRRAVEKTAKVDIRADTTNLKRDIERVTHDQPGLFTIEVDGSTKKLKTKVNEFFADVQGEQAELELGLDTTKAVAEAKAADEVISKMTPTQELNLELKKATLEKVQLQIAKLKRQANDIDINLRTKKGSFERVFEQIQSVEKRLGSLTVIRSLDLGPLTLGKPTGLIGTLATLTTLAGLVPSVVTGVGALADAFVRLAGALAILPGAIGGVVASMATLSIGSKGIGDAFSAMFDVWNEGATEQASSANSLVAAHNSYRNAVVDEAKAQEDVGRARRDALGDLRDLNNELRGAVLNEAQAILDANKARQRYAEARQEGFKGGLEEQQLRLDIFKADQGILDIRERNIDLQQRANDAGSKGVENSDKVQDALEAQTRAAQATAQAFAAITEAQGGAGSTAGAFSDALAKLSPNAQQLVLTLAGLKGEIKGFQLGIQDVLTAGTGPALEGLFRDLMPTIGPGMRDIAEAMNQNILQVFDTLRSPEGESIIERVLGGTADAQRAVGDLIDPMIKSIGRLTAAGAEHLPQLIDLFTRLFERFDAFLTRADETGALDKFMDEGLEGLENIAEIGINVTKIIGDFSDAFRTAFGDDVLSMLADLTGQFHDFLSGAEGQQKLNGFMEDAKELWKEWKPLLMDLPDIFRSIADAAKIVLDAVLPALEGITDFMKENPTLVKGFITAWLGTKVLSGVFSPIYTLFKGIKGFVTTGITLVGKLATAINKIPGLPKIPGVPTTAAGPAAAAGGPGLLGTAATALAIPLTTSLIQTSQIPQDYSVSADDANRQISELGKKLPQGVPLPSSQEASAVATSLSAQGSPAGKWLEEANTVAGHGGRLEFAKRYTWLMTQPNAQQLLTDPAFQAPPMGSYAKGGFTAWDQGKGYPAILHGKEYIQPADTVAHYGVGAMQAIHEKRVPKGMLASFQDGGYFDPATGQWVDPSDPRTYTGHGSAQPAPVPTGQGSWLGAFTQGVSSATQVIGNVATQGLSLAQQAAPGAGGAPGGVLDIATGVAPGGVAPGPAAPGIPGVPGAPGAPAAPGPMDFLKSMFGFGGGQDLGPGWPGGAPPIGLGGGTDGFDIRNFGIGPGPAGSGPLDWAKFVGQTGGEFLSGVGGALFSGLLSGLGLGGIEQYVGTAKGIGGHFLGAPGLAGMEPGAAADPEVEALLQQYPEMAANPDYPGIPGLPNIVDPATGKIVPAISLPARGGAPGFSEINLKPSTLATMRAVAAQFPEITSIGGYEERPPDTPTDHPSGYGLDVNIPNWDTPEGQAYGDSVNEWLRANASKLGIKATIWKDTWQDFKGNSSTETGHRNHIHVQMARVAGDVPTPDMVPTVGTNLPTIEPSGSSSITDWFSGREDLPAIPSRGPLRLPPGGHGNAPGRPGSRGTPPWLMQPPGSAQGDMNPLAALDPLRLQSGGGTKLNKDQIKQIAQRLYLASAMPPGEWGAFEQLIENESSWDPTAKNPGSTAFGLGQFLDSTQAQFGITGSTNPLVQLPAIFAYLRQRPDYKGSPARALQLWSERSPHWYDQGGWLMPGTHQVVNATGMPELMVPYHQLDSFQSGGLANMRASMIRPQPPPPPPAAARQMVPPPPPPRPPTAKPPQAIPPSVTPGAPPVAPTPAQPGVGVAAPPARPSAPEVPAQGPRGAVIGGPSRPATGPGLDEGSHVHPALKKGIESGARALGQAASTAIGIAGGLAGGFGGGAIGAIGPYVAGLIEQGGKIVENVANVGSSFLVGNITGGTTENAYGVTQRGTTPSGGTNVINASTNHFGDIQTSNLEEYFKLTERRQAQRAQSGLGRWGNA